MFRMWRALLPAEGMTERCGCALPGAELLSVYMARLEERPLEGGEETYRTLSGLLALLQAFQADMAPAFRADALAFFGGMLAQLTDMRWAFGATCTLFAPHHQPKSRLQDSSAATVTCLIQLMGDSLPLLPINLLSQHADRHPQLRIDPEYILMPFCISVTLGGFRNAVVWQCAGRSRASLWRCSRR